MGHRRGWVVVLVLLLGAALALACSSFSSNSDPGVNEVDGAPPPEAASSSFDAAPSADQEAPDTSASVDAGPNLIVNGDFEIGCGNWSTASGTADRADDVAHGGLGSCRVCGLGPGNETFDLFTNVTPIVGATYLADVWLRTPDDASVANTPYVQLIASDDLANLLDAKTNVTMTPSWQKAQALITVPDGGTRFALHIVGYGVGCMLVDDVYLRRTK